MSGTVLSPLQGQRSLNVRIRIQSIGVDLTTKPEYPICLKILLDNQVHQRLPEVVVGRQLRWDQVTPIDARPTSYIELRAYEVHRWRKVRIGAVRFRADQVDRSSSELNVNDNTGLVPFSARFSFPSQEMDSSAAQTAHTSATAAIGQNPSVLQSMGRVWGLVDTILTITGQVSELNPITNVTFELCTQAWETIQQQGECDKLVADLVVGMGEILPLVDAVKDKAKLMNLRATTVEMLHLIEDASRFVVEYKSDGAAVRAVRAFKSSTSQEQVDGFMLRFKKLRKDFDRGLMTQLVLEVDRVALGVETLLNDADREMLIKLITPDASYDPSTGCLEGTRLTIRNDIQDWVENGDKSQSIFWLYGLAGCGKSTVTRSVCKQLGETDRLGATFFCKRDNEHLRKPENIVSTVAAHLAFVCQPYGTKLVAALREKPQLSTSALAVRFRGMVAEPIQRISNQFPRQTLVIVVDALDECGTVNSRPQLLACLLEMSQLAPWLKVFITSRPNEEIKGFFRRQGRAVLHRDLFQEDPASVYSDICLYIRDRLAQLMDDDEVLRESSWLDDEIVKQLASRASGLFIWARTACNVICNSVNPDEKIKSRLAGGTSQDTNEQLGALYTTVLDEAIGGLLDDAHKIRRCIAVIIIARTPLVDTALVNLLGGQVNLTELRLVVRRLASVLYRDQSGAVRVVHKSFSDYMVDNRCPADYRMDKEAENLALATSCLRIMVRELKFNICELLDSKQYNHEIPDLANRVQANIKPHLAYSCIHWANHLSSTTVFKATSQEHQTALGLIQKIILGPYALYWIEALSLLEHLNTSETSLLELSDWIKEPSHEISIHAGEIQRFVAAFFLPVSQSTPHLYISALAFGSEQFDTIRALKDRFPNVVALAIGKHLGKISRRWLKVIPHSSSVSAVSYSADGRLLATGSGKMVQIWEARTGTAILNPLQGHSQDVTCVAFSPHNQYIVSGSGDKTVRIWDLCTGTAALSPLVGHSEAVLSVAFSPNLRKVVSGSRDKTVRVWDLCTGAAVLDPLEGHSDFVTSVAFSPDGQYIISGSADKTVWAWNLSTGVAIINPMQGHSDYVLSVACSPTSQYIVSGSADNTVRVWDIHTGTAVLNPLQGHCGWVTSVACSPDGRLIVSGSEDRTVRVWDLNTGVSVLAPLQGHSDRVASVACSPDGQHIVSGSEDNTVRIWDLHIPSALDPLEGHSGSVTSVAFSPDGQHVLSGSADGTVRLWNLSTSRATLELRQEHSEYVKSVAFSPNGQHIVSGSMDNIVRVWDPSTSLTSAKQLQGHSDHVTSVAVSPDGRHVVSGSADETVRVWDLSTGTTALQVLQGHSHWVASVAFSPDGHHIFSGSWDTTVRVWYLHTSAAALDLLFRHVELVTSVACSPEGNSIVSGSADHKVHVWDLRTGAAALNPLAGHSDTVTSVTFSSDGQRIVSGSLDGTVRVWDLRTGTVALGPLRGHTNRVTSVTCSPDGQRIASGSWDSTLRIWDAGSTSMPLNDLPHGFPSSAVPDRPVMSHHLASSLTPTHEGWVLDKARRPLLWLPTHFQRSWADHSIIAISQNPLCHPVSFDFSKFKCGADWTAVRAAVTT